MPVLPSFEQLKNKLITKTNEPENTVNEPIAPENESSQTVSKLDENAVSKILQEYALQKKSEDKMLEFMVFHERTFVLNQQTITLKFGNEMEQNQFNGLKNEFNIYLKSKLGFLPKIETLVEEILVKKQLYSSSDKYNFLKEKFPAIEELKRRLGLELDM